jgi:hypothetical protein
MSHRFVSLLERELGLRKAQYTEAVKSGRMEPQTARSQYDVMQAVLDFIKACEIRYDGEARYGATPEPHPLALQAMAQGDGQARLLWDKWKAEAA